MARARHTISHSNRASSQGEQDFSALSSEVVKLRLHALNLPITGSKGQLLNRLKRALPGQVATSTTVQPKRVSTAKARKGRPATRTTYGPRSKAFQQTSATLITKTDSVRSAITTLQTSPATHLPSPAAQLPSALPQSLFTPGMASPLGLSRPVDKTLEDKILRGEYIDFALLLPDTLYQSQTPEIQLRLDDSSSGPMGSRVTMVRKKKPVIDTFPKWLDAFMTYMLILVNAYPRRALELIKYQQIISRAVAKFKGLAWLSYDQQFRRRAAYDLSLSWDKVDLELWTVTFAGLAKPHCNVCSSPYHAEDVCPSADLNRKSRRPQSVCFDFNKSSGCRRRNCSFPHVCRRCYSSTHPAPECTQPQPSSANKAPRPSDRSKK